MTIPDPLARRHLLERDLDPAAARKIAEAYLEADRRVEALPFLAKAGDAEVIADLRRQAVAEGDVFLLKSACAAAGEEPATADWRAIARTAESSGRLRYAAIARRQFDAERK